MTVSRALRRHPEVNAEIRKNVEKVAARLGYVLNPLVSAWMSHRRATKRLKYQSVMGWITDSRSFDFPQLHPHVQNIFLGAKRAAEGCGYNLEPFCLNETHMTIEKFNRMLYQRNIKGLLIAPLSTSPGEISLLWNQYSAVAIGYTLMRPNISRVASHCFKCMQLALQKIRELGYKRIGLALREDEDELQLRQWSSAFLSEKKPADSHVLPLIIKSSQWNETYFKKWFLKYKPDVIIGSCQEIIPWLNLLGEKIPQDVGYVDMSCESESSPYSGIFQNPQAIGSNAVDFLAGLVQRYEIGIPSIAQSLLVEGRWITGKSVEKQV